MIIDCILDRMDSPAYNPADFYSYVSGTGDVGENILRAMDYGDDDDVRAALCDYIISNGYNPKICVFVVRQNWLHESA